MKVVILCNGKGERMQPVTCTVPKPLIPFPSSFLNDEYVPNLLNTLLVINSVKDELNVDEVVVCSNKSVFTREDYLNVKMRFKEFSDIKVTDLEVGFSSICNNWYSVHRFFKTTLLSSISDSSVMIIEGDLLISKSLFSERFIQNVRKGRTFYCVSYRENEWVFVKRHRSNKMEIVKNASGLAMSGVSVICGEGKLVKLRSRIMKSRNDEYWDQSFVESGIPYELLEISEKDVMEFDKVEDLVNSGYYNPESIAKLVSDDGCAAKSSGMTNSTFLITFNGKRTVFRYPGTGTDRFINRDRENLVVTLVNLQDASLSPASTIYSSGIKLSEFVPECRTSDSRDIERVSSLLKRMHETDCSRPSSRLLVDLIKEIKDYESIDGYQNFIPKNYYEVRKFYTDAIRVRQHQNLVLCHRDLDPRNILISDDDERSDRLIDFEYSGCLNLYWDYGAHLSELSLFFGYESTEDYIKRVRDSSGVSLESRMLILWSGIVDFVWSCWTVFKMSQGEQLSDYLNTRWDRACKVMEKEKLSTQ